MVRGLPFTQILMATVLGVAGGIYIYKPIFEKLAWEQKHLKSDIETAESLGKKE
ncbi:protein PIGBOS1 [Pelodytes ibericus]